MNYFTKNRILIWIVIAAFAINISAIITILYHVNKGKCRTENGTCHHKSHEFIKKELNLTPEQEIQFLEIKKASKLEAEPIVMKMKEQRKMLMSVLFDITPDTIKIKQISNDIEQSQALLLQYTIKHYLDLKKILKNEQQEKLNFLYQDLFGCERMQMGKKCGNNCNKAEGDGSGNGKGDGSGGGKRHRHGANHDNGNDF
ncbi:MAG: Spy/CpxP family protein refolding chaperone [Bacteroidales bacterium]